MTQGISKVVGRQLTACGLCSMTLLNTVMYGCSGAPDETADSQVIEATETNRDATGAPSADRSDAAAAPVKAVPKPLSLDQLPSRLAVDLKGMTYETKFEGLAQQLLVKEAGDQQHFSAMLEQAFGAGYDRAKAEAIRQQILRGDFTWAPKVRIVGDESLAGARGAYDAKTGTVYLSSSIPSKFERTFVYIEELGHHLDTLLNTADAPGDEGALFRLALTRQAVEKQMIERIRTDNHVGTMMVDGQSVEVELLWGIDWIIGVGSAAWNGLKTGAGYVWKGATTAGGALKTAASKTWDGATTLSGWVAQGADAAADAFVNNLQRDFWAAYQTVNGAANTLLAAGYGTLEGMKVVQEGLVELTKGNFVDGTAAIFTGLAKLAVEMPLDTLATASLEAISALQTALYLEPVGRPLNQHETDVLSWVFGGQWWLSSIRIKEGFAGLYTAISDRPFTSQFNIYLKDYPATDGLMVHETTHVWQWVNGGGDYKLESLYQQYVSGAGYNWEPAVNAGISWAGLGVEQQASFVEAAYMNNCYDGANYNFSIWAFNWCAINGVDRTGYFNSVDQSIWAGTGAP
jgi:hypothetical protein